MADEAPEPIRNIGKVRNFVVGTDFEAYAEQLEFFFVANSVTDAKQKKAVLLTNMPAETYQLTKDLFAPHLLKEDTITYEADSRATSETVKATEISINSQIRV